MDCALADSTFLDRARILIVQRRYDLAERELGRALERNPSNPQTYDLLAVCRTHAGDHRAAHGLARRAIELAPTAAGAYTRHAWTILADPTYVPPGTSLWRIINRSPQNDPRLREIMRLIKEALRLDPSVPYAWYLLGITWLEAGRADNALGAAEKGLSVAPGDVGLHNLRAMALAKLGRTKEAAAASREAVSIDPEHAGSHCRRGLVLQQDGQFNEAMDHFVEALRLNPDDPAARAGLFDAMQTQRAVFRWAYLLHAPLAARGLLNPIYMVIGMVLMMTAGALGISLLDLPRERRDPLLRAVVLASICGPLLLVWVRNLGRYVLTFHPQARHLVTPMQRAGAHAMVYLLPVLMLVPVWASVKFAGGLLLVALYVTGPLGVATSLAETDLRRAFLGYAGAFALAATAAAVRFPDPPAPLSTYLFYAGLAAALTPFAALARLAQRRILA